MSLPRRLPPADPEPELLALFEQPERVPKAVRRQADFFVFFARTIFPVLEDYRDRLAGVYCADNGRPAWDPVRLLGVLILQFVLRLPDRLAAEAVQYDQRWRLALHMATHDAAFDPSLLVIFRDRLVNGGAEALAFEAVLDYLIAQGWLPRRSRQRLDSTHVRGLLSAMNRLECARETIRLFLKDVEADGRTNPKPSGARSPRPRTRPGWGTRRKYRIEWSNTVCCACPLRAECVSAGQDHRTFVVGELHSLLQERRREMQTDAFKQDMHKRNGIEGTQSELVRGYGLRQARYRGQAKVRLQNYLIGAACNVRRLFRRIAWLTTQARRVDFVATPALAG